LRYPNPAPETPDRCLPERFQRTAAISQPGAAPERDLLVSEVTGQRRQRTVPKRGGTLVPGCPAVTAPKHQDSGFPPFSSLA